MPSPRPPAFVPPLLVAPRSGLISALAWSIIAVSGACLPISFFATLMVVAGSPGTSAGGGLGAFIVLGGPPAFLVTGLGLLWRRRWGYLGALVGFSALVLGCASLVVRGPTPASTYVSPGGVPTTVLAGEIPGFAWPGVLIGGGVIGLLLTRKVRAEFRIGSMTYPSAGDVGRGPARGVVERAPAAGEESPTLVGDEVDVAAAPPVELSEEKRGWRVGHRGRDAMYYEEWRDGAWQRLEVSGEMLLGRAHHVIYFASPQAWASYPAWARHRRAEIIARIKSAFRPPDYEYAADVPPVSPLSTMRGAPLPGDQAQAVRATHSVGSPGAIRHAAGALRPRAKFSPALALALAGLLAVTGGMAWLVTTGLARGETFFPSKRASQQRRVLRVQEPALFWVCLGVYAGLGAGTLGLAAWGGRETLRQRPGGRPSVGRS